MTKKKAAQSVAAFTIAEAIAALEVSAGIISPAAKRLGCDRTTLVNFIERHPEVGAALERIGGELLDFAEAGLLQIINDPRHPALRQKALEFFLRTKGKQRGFTMGAELTGKGGSPVETESKVTIDISKLTAEELDQLEKAALRAATVRG